MPRTYTSLMLEDAKQMLSAAEAKAASLGLPYCVAVVDAGGHLVAFLFDEINENLDLLRTDDIVGRAVMKF
jgi:uncharacterized protein GlcG (DUF336 family)